METFSALLLLCEGNPPVTVFFFHPKASLVTTSRVQQCFNVLIDIYHEFLLLFYCCVLLEIKLTTYYYYQRPVARSFDVSFDLRLNKRLSKQSRRRWFETPSRPLWRHCNEQHLSECVNNLPRQCPNLVVFTRHNDQVNDQEGYFHTSIRLPLVVNLVEITAQYIGQCRMGQILRGHLKSEYWLVRYR